jgi:hypothetical protein
MVAAKEELVVVAAVAHLGTQAEPLDSMRMRLKALQTQVAVVVEQTRRISMAEQVVLE